MKPDTRRQTLYDSSYMKYLAWSKSWQQVVELWSPGAPGEGRGRCCSVGTVSALEVKTSRDPLHSNVSTVDTAELHT